MISNHFSAWRSLAPEAAVDRLLERATSLPGFSRAVALFPDRQTLRERLDAAATLDKPLAGIPFLLKDLFDVAGESVGASSTFLKQVRPPAQQDGALMRHAMETGLVYTGRSHLHEFAYGLTGENIHYGDCPHPHDPLRLPGGSSSGSAWGVGSGFVPLAFGTDTGGSMRVPAAWCGIYGVRWIQNDWIHNGAFPLAPSFDAAGWFTSTPEDMLEMLSLFGGVRIQESATPRILWIPPPENTVRDDVLLACRGFAEKLGAQQLSVSSDIFTRATQAYVVLQSHEAFAVHKPWIDSRADDYDPVIRALLDRGRHWPAQEIKEAAIRRAEILSSFKTLFQDWDILVLPTVPTEAPRKQESTNSLRARILDLTTPASLARLPALTLPVPLPNGLTVGIQALTPPDRLHVWDSILKRVKAVSRRS